MQFGILEGSFDYFETMPRKNRKMKVKCKSNSIYTSSCFLLARNNNCKSYTFPAIVNCINTFERFSYIYFSIVIAFSFINECISEKQ